MNQTLHPSASANSPGTPRQPVAAGAVEVRPLTTLSEFRACVELQEDVWGPGYADRVPASLLQVTSHIGGVVIGAFKAGELIGMVFGFTGLEGDERVHWSHMLGVRDSARDLGVGRLLKEAQRDALAKSGVTRMTWTFDPLVAKNGFLNLNRLGARVVRYVNDMYGTMTSPLHQGGPSDRLIVTVDTRAAAPADSGNESGLQRQPLLTTNLRAGDVAVDSAVPPRSLWIEVPSDVHLLREHAPEAVVVWRHAVRKYFTWALGLGYEVQALERDVSASRAFYLLSRDTKP